MKNAIQFPFHFDVQRMMLELEAIKSSFIPIHSLRIKENDLMGIHLIIPLLEGTDDQGKRYRFTPELEQSPYLQAVLDTFQCDKLMFRVHNLRAKGKIELHRDSDRGLVNNIVRIHIPVTTNEEVYFYVNGERVCMQNGECWFANISEMHEVENRSDTDRLQLMIDCELNEWWEQLLRENGIDITTFSEWQEHSLEELQLMKENILAMGAIADKTLLEKMDRAIAAKS